MTEDQKTPQESVDYFAIARELALGSAAEALNEGSRWIEWQHAGRMERVFHPTIYRYPLAQRVLAVAKTRVEGAWCVYIDAVPEIDHIAEADAVLAHGCKMQERIARLLFPGFEGLPYAE